MVLSVDDFQAGFRRFVWCSRQMRKNVCPKLDRSEPKVAAALCGIKAVGGIAIAQKLSTAKQPDMPGSALASGCIDFVLSPEDSAREIVRIVKSV